jgi:hypothetical protein
MSLAVNGHRVEVEADRDSVAFTADSLWADIRLSHVAPEVKWGEIHNPVNSARHKARAVREGAEGTALKTECSGLFQNTGGARGFYAHGAGAACYRPALRGR